MTGISGSRATGATGATGAASASKASSSTLSIITRLQLLDIMLGSVSSQTSSSQSYSILYLDGFTTQILSNICGISDLLDYGISLVDNIANCKPTSQDKVYFITPSDVNIKLLVSKHKHTSNVHVFFTTAPSPFQLEEIKKSSSLLSRLVTLKEANVEFVLNPDARGFTTGPEDALQVFYGHGAELSPEYDDTMYQVAIRLASVFVTMKEMPSIRYRAALPPDTHEFPSGLDSRLLATQRLAVELSQLLEHHQGLDQIPEGETCELIIIDRGMDPVSPVVHEWTYESMIYDLLADEMSEGRNVFQGHVLNDNDAMFVKLRHCHFAEASTKITGYCDELRLKSGSKGSSSVKDLDLKSMAKLVRSLPKYQDEMRSLSTHVDIASALNKQIDAGRLTEFGALEQDVIFGNATSKELVSFLSSNQLMKEEDKLRLLLCYSATHLEKLDETRQSQWQKLARLDGSHVKCLRNLEYLGIPVCKREGGSLSSMSFGRRKKSAVRKERNVFGMNNDKYSLARFVPLLAEKLEDHHRGRMSEDEFPYVKPPVRLAGSPDDSGDRSRDEQEGRSMASIASFRTKGKRVPDVATGSPATAKVDTSRVFVFIIGGFTHSELRIAHHMSDVLNKDIFVGGTGLITPHSFLENLEALR
jgi:syntaxin-binding protein 1